MSAAEAPTRLYVVLPVHDRRDLTLRALRSLARCSRDGLEPRVIVVDDGSRDGTAEAVRAAFPGVELLRGDGSLFYAGGTNLGLRAALAAGAEHVVAANDDSVFDAGALVALLACARSNPRSVVGAVLPSWAEPHRVYQVGPVWDTWFGGWRRSAPCELWNLPKQPFEVRTLAGNCLLLPAAALRQVGLMDEGNLPQHGADLDLCARLRRAGWRLLVEPRARVFCQPNSPPSLGALGWGARARALLFERTHPHNLRVLWLTRWRTAPSRLAGTLAFLVFVVRLGLRGLGLSGSWPHWPDPPAAHGRL